MKANGNNPTGRVSAPGRSVHASWPLLLVASLFVIGAFLSWYFSWFGRNLTDADISRYLVDHQHSRRVQHALLQVQQRIERNDPSARQWYPQIIALASHPETEFRLTVAWVMGFDNKSQEFHQALLQLVTDPEPIARRNAALALVRFNDASGRTELIAALSPFEVKAPTEGELVSTLQIGSEVTRGTLLARILQPDNKLVEVRSPLPGKIERGLTPPGARVSPGSAVLSISSDEDSVWEALRGLALIGKPEDVAVVEHYAQASGKSERIRRQAALTASAIKTRASAMSNSAMTPGEQVASQAERSREGLPNHLSVPSR